jgi:hypothetical protein
MDDALEGRLAVAADGPACAALAIPAARIGRDGVVKESGGPLVGGVAAAVTGGDAFEVGEGM